MAPGFSINIGAGKEAGITHSLKDWADTEGLESSDGKVTKKEWKNTINVLEQINNNRIATGGVSIYENINKIAPGTQIDFNEDEKVMLMDAMGYSYTSPKVEPPPEKVAAPTQVDTPKEKEPPKQEEKKDYEIFGYKKEATVAKGGRKLKVNNYGMNGEITEDKKLTNQKTKEKPGTTIKEYTNEIRYYPETGNWEDIVSKTNKRGVTRTTTKYSNVETGETTFTKTKTKIDKTTGQEVTVKAETETVNKDGSGTYSFTNKYGETSAESYDPKGKPIANNDNDNKGV